MNRYRKLHKFKALLLLVCFLTALTGVSALAGQACCGNCAESLPHAPAHAPARLAADSCDPVGEPVEPACACSVQPSDDQGRQVYSISQVSTASDDLLKGWTLTVSTKSIDLNNHPSRLWTIRMEIRARSGPLYLTNQSFLC